VKTRIIVWAVVGLLVVAGVVFIIATSGGRATAKKTLEGYANQAQRTSRELDRLVERADAARAGAALGPDAEAGLQEMSRFEAEARAKLEQIQSAKDTKQAEQLLREAKESVQSARRALELAVPPRRPGGL